MSFKELKEEYEQGFAFYQHGVRFSGFASDGKNLRGICPFSGKEDKFFVNKETGMWDSKNTSRSGNLYTFLDQWYRFCLTTTKNADLMPLAKDRGLPPTAFYGDVAKNPLTGAFMIPAFNLEGKLNALSYWEPKGKIFRTAGVKLPLKGCHHIPGNSKPVYICEGEWDMYALQYWFKLLAHDAVVVALPGAGNLNKDWLLYFKDRKVFCCFDHDEAGRKGEEKSARALREVASEVRFLQWPEAVSDGYDIRDLVLESVEYNFMKATKTGLKTGFERFNKMFSLNTQVERDSPVEVKAETVSNVVVPTRKELEAAFSKYLKLLNYDPITVVMGTCFANKMPTGEPIWQFLVAPPGGGKTTFVSPLSKSPFIETLTTLTPASLISGHRGIDGADPSILPRLNNRVLVIKDFTTILSGHPNTRDEIFGLLRDIYDGRIEKSYSGHTRKYESKFGIIAAVTNAIDGYLTLQSSLGERFMKFRLDKHLSPESEEERILKAIDGIEHENEMKEELGDLCYRMLEKPMPPTFPILPPEFKMQVAAMAMFVSRMRASLQKDRFSQEQLTMPIKEIGTRIGKQLCKLAIGIAVYLDHAEVGEDELRLVRQVACDTCPDRFEYIINLLLSNTPEEPKDSKWLIERTGLSQSTMHRVAEDLQALRIIKKTAGSHGLLSMYVAHPDLADLAKKAGLYGVTGRLKPEDSAPKTVRIRTKIIRK